MEILSWPSGSGKTSELLAYMMLNDDVEYVAPTMSQAAAAAEWFKRAGGDPRGRFHSARVFIDRKPVAHAAPVRYVVDECEAVFATVFGGPVVIATKSFVPEYDDGIALHPKLRGERRLRQASVQKEFYDSYERREPKNEQVEGTK